MSRGARSPVFKRVFETARQQHDWLDKLATAQQLDKALDTFVLGGKPRRRSSSRFSRAASTSCSPR
jgi:hypothetical protein